MWYTSSSIIHKFFRYPTFSETKDGSATKFSGTVRQRLWQKNVIQPPLLVSVTFFDARILLKHRRVALRIFLVLWDKTLEKNCDKPLFSYQKKICETRIFLKHRGVSTRNFSALWNKKISTKNSEFPLLSVGFFDTRFFLKHKRVVLRSFPVLWDTDFDKKLWYTPSSPIHKKFRYPKFSETQKGSPTTFFGIVRQILWQKIVIQPPFSYP